MTEAERPCLNELGSYGGHASERQENDAASGFSDDLQHSSSPLGSFVRYFPRPSRGAAGLGSQGSDFRSETRSGAAPCLARGTPKSERPIRAETRTEFIEQSRIRLRLLIEPAARDSTRDDGR